MGNACRDTRVKKGIVVALGGNAILRYRESGSAEEQFNNVRRTSEMLSRLVIEGWHLVITHGNGPQVGDIILKNELAKGSLPPMPIDICGVESQGMIGYMLQQSLRNELFRRGIDLPVVTVITQTIVDPNDDSFTLPDKPIGPFYGKEDAVVQMDVKGWTMMEDPIRGFMRVLPSPRPLEIVETPVIRMLSDEGFVVIAAGGGGVPVVRDETDGSLKGIEAVIDKDHTAAMMATCLGAEVLLILTDVDNAYIDYESPTRTAIGRISVQEATRLLEQGHFIRGSMRPKVESAIDFVKAGGTSCIITSPEKAMDALMGKAGTRVVLDL